MNHDGQFDDGDDDDDDGRLHVRVFFARVSKTKVRSDGPKNMTDINAATAA